MQAIVNPVLGQEKNEKLTLPYFLNSRNLGFVVKEFDLTDKKILNSEFYYVMPNDVIYAKPMKGKFFAMNQFPFALILTSITTFILVANYIQ